MPSSVQPVLETDSCAPVGPGPTWEVTKGQLPVIFFMKLSFKILDDSCLTNFNSVRI